MLKSERYFTVLTANTASSPQCHPSLSILPDVPEPSSKGEESPIATNLPFPKLPTTTKIFDCKSNTRGSIELVSLIVIELPFHTPIFCTLEVTGCPWITFANGA